MIHLFLTLFSLSVMGSIVILCVILLSKIFRKNYSKRWLYIIWAVIAVRLIIPVNIRIIDIPWEIAFHESSADSVSDTASSDLDISIDELISEIESSESSAEGSQASAYPINENEELGQKANPEAVTTKPEETIRERKNRPAIVMNSFVLNVITIVWLMGTAFVLLYHLGDYLHFRKKINRWSVCVNDKEILDQFNAICTELNVKGQINIVECRQIQSPALVGFIKPCIVLPSIDFTLDQYYFILKHELIHYKHHDLFYKLILLLASALHWFNPFIHYMVYLANNDMELYCDEALVVKNDLVFRENYSKVLLQVITGATKKSNILLATGMGSKNRQLKNRFFQIMNGKPTKKGTCIILGVICIIAVIGNLTALFIPKSNNKPEVVDTPVAKLSLEDGTEKNNTDSVDNKTKQLEKISNVLVVGIEGIGSDDFYRADSILVVSVDPDKKTISLTSILRDISVQVPGNGVRKLSECYQLVGIDYVKETIENYFDIPIDHTVTVNMEGFEKIIDSIGGVEVELSKHEADYLNTTNYISKKKYRNVVEGKQRLNGNQALGYVRVRYVLTIEGEKDDMGRTARLRKLLTTIIEECSKKDILELTEVATNILPYISTDLDLDDMLVYLNTMLGGDIHTNTYRIPADGTYTSKMKDGRSVIEFDMDENRKILQQVYH